MSNKNGFVISLEIELTDEQRNEIERAIEKAVVMCLIDFDLFEDKSISGLDEALGGAQPFENTAGLVIRQ